MLEFKPDITKKVSVWELTGIPERGVKLHEAINQGLPFEVYHRLAEISHMDKSEIARILHLAPATLQRRAKQKKFNVEEGDKIFRLTEMIHAATELFEGDIEKANAWLQNPVRGIGGKRPVDMVVTSAQTKDVLDLIGRLEHGVFA